MDTPPDIGSQLTKQDAEHLRILAIFHYVFGGLGLVAMLMMLAFAVAGVGLLSQVDTPHGPPPGFSLMVSGLVLFSALVSLVFSSLNILAGRALGSGGSRNLIYAAAALNCLHVPLGTALGVFTFIVISRETVSGHFR